MAAEGVGDEAGERGETAVGGGEEGGRGWTAGNWAEEVGCGGWTVMGWAVIGEGGGAGGGQGFEVGEYAAEDDGAVLGWPAVAVVEVWLAGGCGWAGWWRHFF